MITLFELTYTYRLIFTGYTFAKSETLTSLCQGYFKKFKFHISSSKSSHPHTITLQLLAAHPHSLNLIHAVFLTTKNVPRFSSRNLCYSCRLCSWIFKPQGKQNWKGTRRSFFLPCLRCSSIWLAFSCSSTIHIWWNHFRRSVPIWMRCYGKSE